MLFNIPPIEINIIPTIDVKMDKMVIWLGDTPILIKKGINILPIGLNMK